MANHRNRRRRKRLARVKRKVGKLAERLATGVGELAAQKLRMTVVWRDGKPEWGTGDGTPLPAIKLKQMTIGGGMIG